jgi:hypothetical protein
MLTPADIKKINSLSIVERQVRYLELSTKVAKLTVITPIEVQELVILRDLLLADGYNLRTFGMTDPRPDDDDPPSSK